MDKYIDNIVSLLETNIGELVHVDKYDGAENARIKDKIAVLLSWKYKVSIIGDLIKIDKLDN